MTEPRWWLWVAVAVLLLAAPSGSAQEDGNQDQAPSKQVLDTEGTLATLQALAENLAAQEAEVTRLSAAVEAELDEERRTSLLAQLRLATSEKGRLQLEQEALATGLDLGTFGSEDEQAFEITQELLELLRPLIVEAKEATKDLREEDRLRRQLAALEAQGLMASAALERLAALEAAADPGPVADQLGIQQQKWLGQRRRLDNERTVVRYRLDQLAAGRKGGLETIQDNAAEFFRTRGKNLTLAIGTFFGVFVGLRFLYHALRRSRRRRGRTRSFYSRLFMVVFFFCAALAATVAGMLVLYAAQDWVLFVVAVIVLFGFLWAFRHTVPLFLEQIRMLLNLGPVREGERVILDGVPWHVSTLSLYTTLTNPLLSGGLVRVPIRDLVNMRSRPCAEEEVWFPSRQGDWVRLADESRGRVQHQSPEFVVLDLAGAGTRTLPTLDFLGQHPQNLTQGFRLVQTFGIDYRHQAQSTTQIREQMEADLQTGLTRLVGAEDLRSIRIEFHGAGASSLDYAAIVDVEGTLAERYDFLRRAIQRLLVDSCNSHGWEIPFQQITIHRAD